MIDTKRLATDAAYWDELAKLLGDILTGGGWEPGDVADAIIAAGWRKEP